MINTPNEIIMDKYNRLGNLTNKDDFYLFQPLEITDENASIYDRTVPVEFSHTAISMNIPMKFASTTAVVVDDKQGADEGADVPEIDAIFESYNNHIIQLEKDVTVGMTIMEYKNAQKEWTWYQHASRVIPILEQSYRIPRERIIRYIVYHYLYSLTLEEKMSLVRYIYSGKWEVMRPAETIVKEFFDERILESKGAIVKRGIMLTKENKRQMYVQDKTAPLSWKENAPADYKLFEEPLRKFFISTNNLQRIVGFYSQFSPVEHTFKVKDIYKGKGEKCDRAGKSKIILMMNIFDGTPEIPVPYNSENTKDLSASGMCVILELGMQEKTLRNPQQIWFVTEEQSALINLPDYKRK